MILSEEDSSRDAETPSLAVRKMAPDCVEVDTARVILLRTEDGLLVLFTLELESSVLVQPVPADFKEAGSTAFIRWGLPVIHPILEPAGDAGLRWGHVLVVAEELASLDEECRRNYGIGFPAYPGLEGFTRTAAEGENQLHILNWGMTPKSHEHVPEADSCAVALAALARWLTRHGGPVCLKRKDEQHLEQIERLVLAGNLQLQEVCGRLRNIQPIKRRWPSVLRSIDFRQLAWVSIVVILALIIFVVFIPLCDDEPIGNPAVDSSEFSYSGERHKTVPPGAPPEKEPIKIPPGDKNPGNPDPIVPAPPGNPFEVEINPSAPLENPQLRRFQTTKAIESDLHASAIKEICDLADAFGYSKNSDKRKKLMNDINLVIENNLGNDIWEDPRDFEKQGHSEAVKKAPWIGTDQAQIRLIKYSSSEGMPTRYRLWWKKGGDLPFPDAVH